MGTEEGVQRALMSKDSGRTPEQSQHTQQKDLIVLLS
jgi:hypothetical protein